MTPIKPIVRLFNGDTIWIAAVLQSNEWVFAEFSELLFFSSISAFIRRIDSFPIETEFETAERLTV